MLCGYVDVQSGWLLLVFSGFIALRKSECKLVSRGRYLLNFVTINDNINVIPSAIITFQLVKSLKLEDSYYLLSKVSD